MQGDIIKQRVQRYIVIASAAILVGKFMAYLLTNSVGILTDAMESIVNVIAGLISLYSLWFAARPKDKAHPFGHGKVEFISASIEGILIAVAGALIIYEGVRRLVTPAPVERLDIGIIIIAVAGAINYLLGWYSIHMGKRHHSVALVAGGKHLQSDTYSSIGLVAGLTLLYVTNIHWIDSALALIFGSIIIATGAGILRDTVRNLMDRADPEMLSEIAEQISEDRRPQWIDVHNVKNVKYGSYIFIDCDLTLPWYYDLNMSHTECDLLEASIRKRYPDRVQFSVHSDPCDDSMCRFCAVENCAHRAHQLIEQRAMTMATITVDDQQKQLE